MPATETSTVTVPSFCKFLFDSQLSSDAFLIDSCFSGSLPYLLNVNFVMDEASLSVTSEKEPGMFLRRVSRSESRTSVLTPGQFPVSQHSVINHFIGHLMSLCRCYAQKLNTTFATDCLTDSVIFQPISCHISEMVQDKTKVTINAVAAERGGGRRGHAPRAALCRGRHLEGNSEIQPLFWRISVCTAERIWRFR